MANNVDLDRSDLVLHYSLIYSVCIGSSVITAQSQDGKQGIYLLVLNIKGSCQLLEKIFALNTG